MRNAEIAILAVAAALGVGFYVGLRVGGSPVPREINAGHGQPRATTGTDSVAWSRCAMGVGVRLRVDPLNESPLRLDFDDATPAPK